jgi:hypothetical protein
MTWLAETVSSTPSFTRAWKKWTYGNLTLFYQTAESSYAQKSIDGFTNLLRLKGASLPYLIELCGLSRQTDIDITPILQQLPIASLALIASPLLGLLSASPSPISVKLANIVKDLAAHHLQALLFPLALVSHLDSPPAPLRDLSLAIQAQSPTLVCDATALSGAFLAAAADPLEPVIIALEAALQPADSDAQFRAAVAAFLDLCAASPARAFFAQLEVSQRLSEIRIHPESVKLHFTALLGKLHEALPSPNPDIVVPGLYRPLGNSPGIAAIADGGGSRHGRRRVRITGTDGKIYNYLLRSDADVFCDQRVADWFGIVTGLLREDKSGHVHALEILHFPIAALSPRVGL